MSNERIDLTQTKEEAAGAFRKGWHADPHRVPRVPLINYQRELIEELIAELKRCYDLIDCLEDEIEFVVEQIHRPITGGLEWYEVRNNILNQLITNANSSTIQVLEALDPPASE